MTSVVFPGQGSQYKGMTRDFFDNFKIAKQTLEEIQDYTSINIKEIMFDESSENLNQTNITQISIFAASMIIFKCIEYETSFNEQDISFMLGHSLGEYSALAASKKLNIKDCALILKKRGELMNSAVEPNLTSMAAIIGLNSNQIKKIIVENNLDIEIANDNSPLQVVISGNKNNINKSEQVLKQNGAKKFVLLNVSAAFHSKYMLKSQEILKNNLRDLNFNSNKIKIVSNYNAKSSNDNQLIIEALSNQMANKVRWVESIKEIENEGESKVIEIGPGKILSGLIKRISNNFDIISINEVTDLKFI